MTVDNYIFELKDEVARTHVQYPNRFGITLVGDLYQRKDLDPQQQHPALVIGAPYGGVKEQGPGIYAQELADRGFVVLTFDPSFNGYSGGEPRHVSSPEFFTEDFSASVDFVGTRPMVDRQRVGAIGICGSGGFALSAAQVDHRIKAVATVSMYDISRVQRNGFMDSMTDDERQAFLDDLGEQRYQDFEQRQPALSGRGAPIGFDATTDPIGREFGEFYSTMRGYHPNSITQFTATSTMGFVNFSLLTHLKDIAPRPILLVAGENAHSLYFSEDVAKQAGEPCELYLVPGAGHVDLYDKAALIPFTKLEDFFTQNLK